MDTSGKGAAFITRCLIIMTRSSIKIHDDEEVEDDDNGDDDDDDFQQGGDDHDDEVLPGEAGDHRG